MVGVWRRMTVWPGRSSSDSWTAPGAGSSSADVFLAGPLPVLACPRAPIRLPLPGPGRALPSGSPTQELVQGKSRHAANRQANADIGSVLHSVERCLPDHGKWVATHALTHTRRDRGLQFLSDRVAGFGVFSRLRTRLRADAAHDHPRGSHPHLCGPCRGRLGGGAGLSNGRGRACVGCPADDHRLLPGGPVPGC
ncbi:hypothetical protein D3C87_1563770 [compost metagenome]